MCFTAGSERHPQGCSCRTMFLIGYMITYMNYTGFAAGITSLLAVNSDAVSLPWQRILHAHLPLVALCDSHADKYLKVYLGLVSNTRFITSTSRQNIVGAQLVYNIVQGTTNVYQSLNQWDVVTLSQSPSWRLWL